MQHTVKSGIGLTNTIVSSSVGFLVPPRHNDQLLTLQQQTKVASWPFHVSSRFTATNMLAQVLHWMQALPDLPSDTVIQIASHLESPESVANLRAACACLRAVLDTEGYKQMLRLRGEDRSFPMGGSPCKGAQRRNELACMMRA